MTSNSPGVKSDDNAVIPSVALLGDLGDFLESEAIAEAGTGLCACDADSGLTIVSFWGLEARSKSIASDQESDCSLLLVRCQ